MIETFQFQSNYGVNIQYADTYLLLGQLKAFYSGSTKSILFYVDCDWLFADLPEQCSH